MQDVQINTFIQEFASFASLDSSSGSDFKGFPPVSDGEFDCQMFLLQENLKRKMGQTTTKKTDHQEESFQIIGPLM